MIATLQIQKNRLMGRRSCPNGHPNNTAIAAISPREENGDLVCRQCGSPVTVRSDDIDEKAIDIRLDIYFDGEKGTLASVHAVEEWAASRKEAKVLRIDGEGNIDAIHNRILEEIGA